MAHPWESHWLDTGKLGGGGQGVARRVTSITDPHLTGVLKYLKNNKSSAARSRMRREVAALQSLVPLGAKVPSVLDHNTELADDLDVELYLVMEYIPGDTLKALVEARRTLTVDEALALTLDVCRTLQIGHREPLLHRDIKPDNIIVRDAAESDVVIIDYGLSFNSESDDLTETEETFRNKFLDLPETNTPGSNRRDLRSDVTQTCGLLYYMLTGHRPGHLNDGSGAPPHMRRGYSVREAVATDERVTAIESILNRGFTVSLDSRFQTIDELISRLEALQHGRWGSRKRDPIATALELSKQLQQQDKITKAAVRRPAVEKLMQVTTTAIGAIASKLDGFGVQIYPGGIDIALPIDMELISGPYTIAIGVNNHSCMRMRVYAVGIRGNQCVVLTAACAIDKYGQATVGKWKEVAWYDDVIPQRDLDIEVECSEWLDDSLQSLVTEVLTGTTGPH